MNILFGFVQIIPLTKINVKRKDTGEPGERKIPTIVITMIGYYVLNYDKKNQ